MANSRLLLLFSFTVFAIVTATDEKTSASQKAKSTPSIVLERFFKRLNQLLFEPPRAASVKGATSSGADSDSGTDDTDSVDGSCPAITYRALLRSQDPSAPKSHDNDAPKALCDPLPLNDSVRGEIELVNHTQLSFFNVRDKRRFERSSSIISSSSSEANETSANHCSMILVYAHFCPFSKKIAPSYVALAKAFPQIAFYAIPIHEYKKVKSAMSAMGVPRLYFMRKGKTVSVYNHSSKSFDTLKSYVHNLTGFSALDNVSIGNGTNNVTVDYGPFVFDTEEFDAYLLLSWAFLIALFANYFFRSSHGERFKRRIVQLWLEHEHVN